MISTLISVTGNCMVSIVLLTALVPALSPTVNWQDGILLACALIGPHLMTIGIGR